MPGSTVINRYLCSELVFVTRKGRRGWRGILGNLEEIGERFAEILTESAFPKNAEVRISSRNRQLEGVVESCKLQRPLGFFVKIKLAPQSRWSQRWFRPRHLLRLWAASASLRGITECRLRLLRN